MRTQSLDPDNVSARSQSPCFFARFAARSWCCAEKCAAVRLNTSSWAALNRRHITSPCARGASATCFHRACSSRMRASNGFEVGLRLERVHLAVKLFLHLQVGPALPLVRVAQFLNPGTERRARLFETRLRLLSILLGGQRRAIVERRFDVAKRAIARLERDLLRCRQSLNLATSCCSRRRLSCSCFARACICSCSISSRAGHRLLEPFGRSWICGCVLAQDIGVAAESAPPDDHVLGRLPRLHQLLELGRQRLETRGGGFGQHPATFPILEQTAGILETARQRSRVFRWHRWKSVPPHFQFGNAIRRRQDPTAPGSLRRSRHGQPVRVRPPALAPLRQRAPPDGARSLHERLRSRRRTGLTTHRRSRRRPAVPPTPCVSQQARPPLRSGRP